MEIEKQGQTLISSSCLPVAWILGIIFVPLLFLEASFKKLNEEFSDSFVLKTFNL